MSSYLLWGSPSASIPASVASQLKDIGIADPFVEDAVTADASNVVLKTIFMSGEYNAETFVDAILLPKTAGRLADVSALATLGRVAPGRDRERAILDDAMGDTLSVESLKSRLQSAQSAIEDEQYPVELPGNTVGEALSIVPSVTANRFVTPSRGRSSSPANLEADKFHLTPEESALRQQTRGNSAGSTGKRLRYGSNVSVERRVLGLVELSQSPIFKRAAEADDNQS